MTDYYPGFIQDASGSWVTHPQAYQPIPGTTAGVDTGTLLQGSVSYTAPAPTPAPNPWAGYTATTPTTLTPMTPIPSVLTPSTLTPMTPTYGTTSTPTLTGGVQTTQVPLNTELGQYNPPGYVAPLPQSQPGVYQAQPYYPAGTTSTPTQIQSGGLGSGGVYGTVNSMSGTNQNVGQPSLYLQQPSTSTISTNPGAIGAFNPSLYPNGITGYQSGDLAAAAAQAAAIQSTVPDARFLPGGMFYGQNPATTGQPMTTSIAAAINQYPQAYPQTVVNTVNQQYYGQPLQGSVSTTPTQQQQQQLEVQVQLPQENPLANTISGLMAAMAQQPNKHRIGPVAGYNAGDILGQMPAIAQAQDVMSDIGPTPAQVWAANQGKPGALSSGGNPQVQGNPMAYQPGAAQRDYSQPAQAPMPQFPAMNPEWQQYKQLFNEQVSRNRSDMGASPPPMPMPASAAPGWRGQMRGLAGAVAPRSVGARQAEQYRQDLTAWKQAAGAAAKQSQDALQHQTGMINTFGPLAQGQAKAIYDAQMDAWKAQQLTQQQKMDISKQILQETPLPGEKRNALIEHYNREFNHNFASLADVVSQTGAADLANKKADLRNKTLSNDFNSRTLDARVLREQKLAEIEEDRASILEATKGAEIRLANSRASKEESAVQLAELDKKAKEIHNQFAPGQAQADLANKKAELENKRAELINKRDAHQAHEIAALDRLKKNAESTIKRFEAMRSDFKKMDNGLPLENEDFLTAGMKAQGFYGAFSTEELNDGVFRKSLIEQSFGVIGNDGLPADVRQAFRFLNREYAQKINRTNVARRAQDFEGSILDLRQQFKEKFKVFPEQTGAPPWAYDVYRQTSQDLQQKSLIPRLPKTR